MRQWVLWMVMMFLSDGQATDPHGCTGTYPFGAVHCWRTFSQQGLMSQTWRIDYIVVSTITVSIVSKVSISCPSSMADTTELMYQLFFNSNLINEVHLKKQKKSGCADCSFSHLFEVTAHSSGVYSCRRESIYPPPSKKKCHTTVVVVGENLIYPTTNKNVSLSNQTLCIQPSLTSSLLIPELVLWVGCGILLVYSLSVTCIAICIWRKMKREEEDSNEYVNTRPARPGNPARPENNP